MEINPLKRLYTDFISILKTSVIKYRSEADKYETLDMKKSADEYIRAVLEEDTFKTHYQYDEDAIRAALNLLPTDDVSIYQNNRDLIPYEKRDEVLLQQRKCIISKYVEQNNYYRCLNGLPDYGDTNYIYIDSVTATRQAIPSDIPIHELEDHQIMALEQNGDIDRLMSKYPDKKYLKYLGVHKVDIIEARRAKNFSVIRQPTGISESLLGNFSLIYEQCREYFMTCIYITEYRSTIDYYDNFIAMCIMIMTIQQIMARVIKNTIERDFFDNYCCQLLFDAYGVPYNPNMDSTTRAQLTQNLNMLVRNKGTNKVIYDISAILGYDRLQIFKYYLIKTRKFDSEGLPVELTVKDPETGKIVPDYKNMYEIYFQKIPIEDSDLYDNIINVSDKLPYKEVIAGDPYWWDDDAVEKLLYESEYNYVETKYMGVGISYRMTRVLFENIYLLKLILDEKDKMVNVILDLPKITPDTKLTLFDTVVLMCALVCKQNNLNGEILIDTSKILHVVGWTRDDYDNIRGTFKGNILGFNTEYSVEDMHNMIKSDPYLNNDLCKFFTDSSSYTASSINNLYKKYKDLYEVVVDKMASTSDKDVYQSYKKFYQAFFYTKENRRMFNVGTANNPEYPDTYMEYIHIKYPDIYEHVNGLNEMNLHSCITYIISRFASAVTDLKTIGFFNDHSSIMETMLLELIRFFKSYTTDLLNLDIVYLFDLKPDSLIRLIDYVESVKIEAVVDDSLNISYADNVEFNSIIKPKSILGLNDKVNTINALVKLYDNVEFMDRIKFKENGVESIISDFTMGYEDIIKYIGSDQSISTSFKLKDECVLCKDDD